MWSGQEDRQFIGRVWRHPQTKRVIAYRLMAMEMSEMGPTERYGISVYPGTGTVDGSVGDHIIIAPPYNVTETDIEFVAKTVRRLICDFFAMKLRER